MPRCAPPWKPWPARSPPTARRPGTSASATPSPELVRSSNSGASGPGATGSPNFVVVHVPLDALVDDAVEPTELAGELEQDGLIDCETVQRMACDATIAVAIDDDVGHTMYEGRARRFPTDAQRREVMRRDRHCRFPGCTNVTFTNVHHIVPWEPGGTTDLDNLALDVPASSSCGAQQRLDHVREPPTRNCISSARAGRLMTSRPSPLWTRATAAPTLRRVGPRQSQPRRLRSSAATSFPLAFPAVAFMTAPVKNAHQLVFTLEEARPLVGVGGDHLVEHGAQGVGRQVPRSPSPWPWRPGLPRRARAARRAQPWTGSPRA